MWSKRVSRNKPKEREVVNGRVFKRRNISNVFSTQERTSYWEYEECEEDKSVLVSELKDKIAELEKELKDLGEA